eukprot:6199746-Pleurochrysis_carterae.AAC.3
MQARGAAPAALPTRTYKSAPQVAAWTAIKQTRICSTNYVEYQGPQACPMNDRLIAAIRSRVVCSHFSSVSAHSGSCVIARPHACMRACVHACACACACMFVP